MDSHNQEKEKGGSIRRGWLDAHNVKRAWSYLIKFLDRSFKDCNIIYGDKFCYDLSQHNIYVRRRFPFNKVHFISNVIEMILMNLVPGFRKVMYQDKVHYFVSQEDVDKAASRFSVQIYPRLNKAKTIENLDKHLKRIHSNKKEEERPPLSREELSYMYYQKELSVAQIASLVGVKDRTVYRWMDDYNLPRRKAGLHVHISHDKLYDLYYVQDFTLEEIGKILNVSKMTVLSKMKEYGMDRRDRDFTTKNLNYREKAFRSVLRKRIRRNPYYIEVIEDVLNQAKEDPHFYDVKDDGK